MSESTSGIPKDRELALAEEKARSDRELKQRELDLAQAKLDQDKYLKEQELQVQSRQLAAGRWSGPVAVALVAGSLGIIRHVLFRHEKKPGA